MAEESKVFLHDYNDPGMQAAVERARATFKYFWRELSWEQRRIVPGLDLSAVKAPFSDGPRREDSDDPQVEHMWMNEIDFDGRVVRGILLNKPNWIQSVTAGDAVQLPLEKISDWMYGMSGKIYGAHTVNYTRSQMSPAERKDHDQAWGLDFGDPNTIRLVPNWNKKAGVEAGDPDQEHPMSENMAPSLREQLSTSPEMISDADERGWTWLHSMCLSGSLAGVKIFVEFGADVNAKAKNGATPLQLAQRMKWEKIAAFLKASGAIGGPPLPPA